MGEPTVYLDPMAEKKVTTRGELEEVLSKVRFNPSCVNLDWRWDLKPVFEEVAEPEFEENQAKFRLCGWRVRTSFVRPDTNTGKVERGYGRWEYVERGTSESGAAKTCWLLAELIVRHELMEAFTYSGERIFDPHHTVAQLAAAGRAPRF